METGTAVNVAETADGADAAIRLEWLWESASKLDLMPSGLDPMDFVYAADDLVAPEYLSTNELAKSASDTDCDDGAYSPPTVSSAAAVDTLHMYFSTLEFSNDFGLQLGDMEVAVLKSALTRHV